MNEISEQEAREAAKSMQFLKDAATSHELSILARWAVVELSRRDAEMAERALPIDAEWLESIGWERRVTAMGNTYRADGNFHEFGGVVFLCGCELKNVKSRVQLLDLLRALKGGAT